MVDYRIVMCNRTPYDKSDVVVYFDGKFAAAAGNMVPGALKSFGSVRLLPPENGEVRWRGEHGAKSVMVSIDGIPANGLDDCLLFFIIEADDRVQFVYVPRDDRDKYHNIAVSLVPFRRGRTGDGYINDLPD